MPKLIFLCLLFMITVVFKIFLGSKKVIQKLLMAHDF